MNYKEFNDYELLDYIHSCNEDANEIILYKYRPLIISIAKKMIKYCNGGVDMNDLIQEGMLGLNSAINSYRDDKDANFGTYAKLCIERRISSLVKSTQTNKNKILNESISIEQDDDINYDRFLADNSNDPAVKIINNDYQKDILIKLDSRLTPLEKQVLELRKNNFDYKEIAEILEKDKKSIDNALQRIKAKLKSIMHEL